jgi:hypothetical protein
MEEQISWDYLGWMDDRIHNNPYTQKYWNQTLLTVINQASHRIYARTCRGGGNQLRVNPIMLLLLQELEYFKEVKDNKFKINNMEVVIDKTVSVDEIIVSHHDPMFETLRLSNMVLTVEEVKLDEVPKAINGFDDSYIMPSNYSEFKIKFLLIDSTEYTEALENPNIRVVTEDMLSQGITILNYPN